MKKLISLNVIVLLLSFSSALAQWNSISDYQGGATDGTSSFEINGKIYVGGGIGKSSFYELNPSTDTWTQKASIPGGINRGWVIGFSINGKGYMGGGDKTGSFDLTSDFYEYDPASDTWSQIANFGGGNIDGAYASSLNGKGYVFGGFNGSTAINDVWSYDPTSDTWTKMSDYPGGQAIFPTGFTLNDKIYVGTGSANGMAGKSDFYEYSPITDSWSQKANLPSNRQACIGFSIGGIGYIGGGEENYTTIFTDFYAYDHVNDVWGLETALAFPSTAAVAWSTACAIGNDVYMGTGADFNGGTLNYSQNFYKAYFQPNGIDSPESNYGLQLYPNPASSVINLKWDSDDHYASLTIYDSIGKVVLKTNQLDAPIDVSQLSKGIYTVQLSGTTQVNKRIIIK